VPDHYFSRLPESAAGQSELRPRRRGFTVIELLVVISIIGLLVGLLLPAVQSARESSRRSQCANNMRQLGTAIHDFHSRFGFLPSSPRNVTGSTPPPATSSPLSWEAYLMPDLDQETTFNHLDASQNWSSTTASAGYKVSNSVVVATRMGVFECASSTDPSRQDGDPAQNPWTPLAACTDYSTITQVEQRTADAGLVDAAGLGIMPTGMRATFDAVADGLSSTLLLVESAGRPQVYRGRKVIGTLPTNRVNGGGWSRPASDFGLDGVSADGSIFPGTCAMNCTNGEDIGSSAYPYAPPYGTAGTGETYSFHPGGANLLLGDGSVRFGSQGVDIRVYARLVTRDKNDLASPDKL
jgi:prepilin-type N-terminal cleavage/methylation domain-containing protein/prepilin-type processing-associated H-X9-DG protein